MINIKTELSEKKEEVELFLNMIDEMTNAQGYVSKIAILKSAYIVMLYNMIESTMSLIFERVHEKISTQNYGDLAPKIKAIWVDYFFKKHPEKHFQIHLDKTIEKTLEFPLLPAFSNRIKLFSGNLDGKKLDELLQKYGIGTLSTSDREQLLIIKEKRNKIAHGELMFKEACRNMTTRELQALRNASFSALESVVQQTESYFSERKFLLA